ncbi:MAG: hypothetical protein R2697_23000 [Ilumatobacteraceae bacterium]
MASVAAAVAVVAAGIVVSRRSLGCTGGLAAGSQGCSYGSGGPKADALCWVDFAEFGNVPASEVIAGDVTKSMTVSLGRYTVTFDATITKGDDGAQGVFASALPTWGGSVLGNPGLPGSPYYVGTTGKPSLYQYMYDGANNNGGLRDTITLSDIKVQDTVLNQPVTSGYSLVMADAESTDEYEGFHWTSDAKLTEYTRVVPPGWTEPWPHVHRYRHEHRGLHGPSRKGRPRSRHHHGVRRRPHADRIRASATTRAPRVRASRSRSSSARRRPASR